MANIVGGYYTLSIGNSIIYDGDTLGIERDGEKYNLKGTWKYETDLNLTKENPYKIPEYLNRYKWSYQPEHQDMIKFVIDKDAASQHMKETGIEVWPKAPVVKNTGYRGDSGIDLFAPYEFVVPAHSGKVVSTFIRFYLPDHLYARILPRGGDKFIIGSGVIDTGYSGILKVRIINPYSSDMAFGLHDSIGQLVPMLKPSVEGLRVKEIDMLEFQSMEQGDRKESGRINNE